jgi:hypothetical protein
VSGAGWSDADTARIRELREAPSLTEHEREELRALRRRETTEAFRLRRALYARHSSTTRDGEVTS